MCFALEGLEKGMQVQSRVRDEASVIVDEAQKALQLFYVRRRFHVFDGLEGILT